ncbi:MAG: TIGR04282 family arsenosugar biosynthesis glycosyltransferase, partial [Planctomycetota bacterium]
MMGKVLLLIFAKYPQPGMVKTRLYPPLLPVEAAEVHLSCIRHVCGSARPSSRIRDILAITPDHATDGFREIVGDDLEIWPQGAGDLGDRLDRCLRRAFDDGAERVICIGTDSPTMPAQTLDQAQHLLDRADLVLGPCQDGGFYLLGLRAPAKGLFERVRWGGPHVADRVSRNAARLGLRVAELDPWYDLDRPADLRRAVRDL